MTINLVYTKLIYILFILKFSWFGQKEILSQNKVKNIGTKMINIQLEFPKASGVDYILVKQK